ncbi:chemotaxis protein CheB [Phototrophicus methaneseepsis]|uniref:protein-glutamate methylesterase n=1 Tax=Phototrophicus methaneseepsis TaxID=2710758 RepID=A0A7S8IDN4_9CHLR|nr:chemotaxis protein CheB [Phototrophicus methaneseepsis]QPC81732.1 chemotaxis protein CheB [Phototrophicus methaneseepsis]
MAHHHDIIVIGASAGGVEALIQLVQSLPADLPAAMFIVLHVASGGASVLPQILTDKGHIPAVHPQSGDSIENGKIYVAPNDHHLIIDDGVVVLSNGPRENGFRPAVDSLFRTAANTYGSRVVGVILTGLLDNGSAGLVSVKRQGGIAIVQDPEDAMFSSMPESALKVVQADYVLPLAQIPETLVKLASTEVTETPKSGDPSRTDSATTGDKDDIYMKSEGKVTDMVCPECGGVIVEYHEGINNNLVRFECRVGHRYSLQSMLQKQEETVEAALWAAVRSLEENSSLFQRMKQQAYDLNNVLSAERYAARAQEAEQYADVIRQILLKK